MTKRGRLVSRLLAVLLAVVGSVAVGAPPATASHFRTLRYVALGDSYAAGQGGGEYLNDCKQTGNGYPELLDSLKHIRLQANAGCSGATTSDVIDTQVSALNKWIRLVTLTVGANDLRVADVAATCTAVPADCEAAIAKASGRLSGLADSLPNVYKAIAAAAPRTEILVTGYPYLFDTPTQCTPEVLIFCQINVATAALNQTIEDTVKTAQEHDVNIEYVDVTAAFAGHGINSTDAFINGPLMDDAFHPNGKGYGAYAVELRAALSRNQHKVAS